MPPATAYAPVPEPPDLAICCRLPGAPAPGPGAGNTAYSQAARAFFRRWPDPQAWAGEPLPVRLSAGRRTRPFITFLMLRRASAARL